MNCQVTVCNNILFIIIRRRGKKEVFLVPLGCSHDTTNNVLSGMSSSNLCTFLHFVYIGHFEIKKGNWAKWNHHWGHAIQLFIFPVPSNSLRSQVNMTQVPFLFLKWWMTLMPKFVPYKSFQKEIFPVFNPHIILSLFSFYSCIV